MSKPTKQKERPPLKLFSTMTTNTGVKVIRAFIGDPPYSGKNQLSKETKRTIVEWRRDHTQTVPRAFAQALGVPFHTYKNWQQAAAGSQVGKATTGPQTKEATRRARQNARAAVDTRKHEAAGEILKGLAPKPRAAKKVERAPKAHGLADLFPHQTGADHVPTLHLRNGARITGLSLAQLTELAKGLG